jgi:hypothetical protein
MREKTHFTRTKVHILTQKRCAASSPGEDEEYKEALFYMRDLSSQLRREVLKLLALLVQKYTY